MTSDTECNNLNDLPPPIKQKIAKVIYKAKQQKTCYNVKCETNNTLFILETAEWAEKKIIFAVK